MVKLRWKRQIALYCNSVTDICDILSGPYLCKFKFRKLLFLRFYQGVCFSRCESVGKQFLITFSHEGGHGHMKAR